MPYFRVRSRDIEIGATLLWDVFDHKGGLLLKKGAVITSGRQALMLIERGLYQADAQATTPVTSSANRAAAEISLKDNNPFDVIEHCAFRLSRVLFGLSQGQNMLDNLQRLVSVLVQIFDKDPDAALGAVHLLHGHAYTTIHPIHTAALCHSLGTAAKLTADELKSLVAAALTSNIGMLELQETLHTQTEKLSDAQRAEIAAHPGRSVEMLQASGITDQAWLDIVMQHHERANGLGYPHGLTADRILPGAKILALADVYCAMISPRTYRDSLEASAALKTLFLERGKEYDETLAVLLIKRMGVYPPGSFVQLKNGETAIVVRRTGDSMKPSVASIVNPKGMPYSRPLPRDPVQDEFQIKGMVAHNKQMGLNLAAIWGYG